MKKIDKVALLEGLKELVRTALIATVPLLISGLEAGKVDWRIIGIAGVIALLRAIDKWAHSKDIETPLDLKWIK